MSVAKNSLEVIQLENKKRRLLDYLLEEEETGEASPTGRIPVRAAGDTVPLSFSQQRLWLLDQIMGEDPVYNICAALRLRGRLETAALAESLNEVVRRHEVLRTVFATADDEPAQLVFNQRHLDLPIIDLTGLPYDVEEIVQFLVSEGTLRPFNLAQWPLFRATLAVLGDLDYVLFFSMHHIVSDGWSLGILKREIASLYGAFSAGAPSHLPDLEIQYGDFVVWQRDWLEGPAAAADLDYWKAQLRGRLPIMELPSGRRRPLVQTSRGASITVILPSSSAEGLNLLCRREGVTLFMVLLAAFKILLYRYTGEHDLIVGTPIANRNRAEVEPLIGFFLNTLVLRTDLSGDPPFVELLNRIRRVALESYSHQDIPFEKLVEELRPERELSRPPLFQIMFNMLNVGDEVFMLPGLSIEDIEVPETQSKFDLTLYASEENGELSLTTVFSTDVLDRCTVERALFHFRNLLLSAQSNPSQRIQALPLEDTNESGQLCSAPGCETRPGDSTQSDEQDLGESIWHRFERQVEKYSSSIAISSDSDQWSYEHLGDRATRIAEAILNEFGFQEKRIAILFETGAPMISALLGLLAAGKTYVPLEPSYPEERLRYILRDSQASAILTDDRDLDLANRLAGSALSIINIDSLPSNISGVNIRTLSSASIAYILYTSGSTGTPKGVFQNQQNVLHHIRTYTDGIRVNHEDRLTLLSSYSFDAAVMDIFGALLYGATLCPMRLKVDGVVRLPEWLIEQSITIYHSTPTAYRYFAATLTPMNRFPCVRVVVLGGEEVIKDDVEIYRRHFSPNCTFVNGLGPTESTLALQRFVDHAESIIRDSVPVGYPVQGTSVTLANNAGRQLAIYGTGEIRISSSRLALGYWRQPDLSAAAFIPDPEDPHKTLYRTGDLGRLLPDGSIEYVGRIDQQVKVRGFRVELAEIEAVLSQHPTVAKAVVVSSPVGWDHKLVAYLVPRRRPRPSAHELATFSRARLPDYMVPAAFHVVDDLPLTPSGKVDRMTLVRGSSGPESLENTHAPELVALGISLQRRTPVQEIVGGIVAEVLGLSVVNDSDNFFDMGGHSLLAMLVVSRVRAAFGVELPLRAFFESPTVVGLSGLIERARLARLCGLTLPTGEIARGLIKQAPRSSAGEDNAPARFTRFDGTGESRHFPLSFAQRRLYFLERLQPGTSVYNIPTAVKLSGRLNVAALDRSLVEVVNRHGSLRTSFTLREGEPIQVVGPQQSSQLDMVDLYALPREERELKALALAGEETRRPFDLENGALLRTRLVRLDPENQHLLFTMHHIVSDGWSVGIFTRDVAELYESCSAGSTHKLKELPIDYTDFAAWERSWFESERLDLQLDYWRKQLAGAPGILSLPLDRPRPAIKTFRGARQFRALPLDLSQELQRLGRRQGVTLFMTLLAGFSTLLSRYSAQDDLIVGTPIAGRNQPEIEDLIGLFVNTLALRVDLSDNPAFSLLLERVREVALGAYAHRALPFDKLVEELRPDRGPGRQPLVQVMFVLQNMPEPELNMPGIDMAALDLEGETSKFDLTFSLIESESGLIAAVEYDCDLLDSTTVQRMIEQYHLLLEKVSKDPAYPIRQIQLLVETARHQVLYEWNHAMAVPASQDCIHESFESQARQRPDSIAVVSEDESLSYTELNGRANQLAHYLRKSGVVAESPVGLYLERGLDMVVAIAGVLKAGGAYVPLDASYPRDRLDYLLKDSRSRVVLTQMRIASNLPNHDGHSIRLDSDWNLVERESGDNPCGLTTSGNTAYIIYTSGSTGNPKGVPVTHANAGRLFAATCEGFRFDYDDVWTLFHSHAFDFSVWELWGALLFGGRLVVVPYLVSRSPQSFYGLVCRERVTVLNQTPSAFRHFVDASAHQNANLSLRMVIFGGEALDPSSLIPWMVVHGDRYPQFVNMYGITETTVHVTSYTVTGHDVFSTQRSLVGRPISDLDLYILDDCLQLSPISVAGEIHVGGAGLARGYLDRPSLTAERFVANPFSSMPGARLYRTGDLGRRLPDGQIEHLGRRDDQVKIRGFRVELGELESLLAGDPSVRDAVVVARENELAERQLIAYLVLANGARSPLKHLRNLLKQKLPDYMMPASFVVLDHLPLTNNGKVDRSHLPRPDRIRPELEQTFVPPSTAEERDMTRIWKEVLDIETVGVADNFFALGGDSIRSIRVKALADERGLGFSLEDLFQNPTIRDLTKAIRAANKRDGSHERPGKFRLLKEHDRLMLPEGLIDAYPLARLQSGMLFHGEYSSQSIYHDVFSFHLRLQFSQDALRRAAQQLIDGHDVLRTTIDTSSFSEPLQLVREGSEASIDIVDLRHLDPQEQETAIGAWIARETMRPFDLMHGPLLRFQVHLRGDSAFQFTVSFHHAILDGWSNASMLAELFHHYELILGKRTDPVPPAPRVFYSDFVAMERQSIQSDEARRYWTENLKGSSVSSLPRLPRHLRHDDASDSSSRMQEVLLPTEMCQKLHHMARTLGLPLKSILLAAHLRVLSLMTGQTDVTTGVITNGRLEKPDGDRVLGLFLNTVPFRFRLRGGTWFDLLTAVFDAERQLFPFRRFPLAEIQRLIGGYAPFETIFNYVQFHVYDLIEGRGVEVLDKRSFEEMDLPFVVYFSPAEPAIFLRINYHVSEFSKEQIDAIGRYYLSALTAIAERHEGRYDTCLLLPVEEQQLSLSDYDSAPAERAAVHDLFSAVAEQRPEAIAVIFGDQLLTYGELNRRSNSLARMLRRIGVGADSPVGICLERSFNMVIAVLATLKAGGACMPIDPVYPRQRISFLLEDSEIAVLLTQAELAARLPETSARVICLDRDQGGSIAHDNQEVFHKSTPSESAYVIYTSGSTGKPKGVVQTHECLSNLVGWHIASSPQAGRTLQYASLSFDVSFQEIFSTLCSGGQLFLLTESERVDMAALGTMIGEKRIQRFHIPNVVLEQLSERYTDDAKPLSSLRELMVGGEKLQITEPVARLFGNLGYCRLHNHYGPSETHVITSYQLPADVRRWSTVPPIGTRITGSRTRVLDSNMMPSPAGVQGELYLGGSALARGYLNRADFTAERFSPDPYGPKPGARFYKTGDLARILPDRNLEFIGRNDYQIKIRGHRVELAEIETALYQSTGVREAVATLVEEAPGDKRILAYIASNGNHDFDVDDLRAGLKEKLPGYMVPSTFVLVDSLPRTANGKVDRSALPTPNQVSADRRKISYLPRDPIEAELAAIWRELLGVEPVGADDNFFDLGGHSLLATQLISWVRKVFATEIPLKNVFDTRTLADFAGIVRNAMRAQTRPASERIERLPYEGDLLPSFAQERMLFLDILDPDNFAYILPFTVRLTGRLNAHVLEQCLSEIVRRHEALRTCFPHIGDRPYQVITPAINLTVDRVDLNGMSNIAVDKEISLLAATAVERPFDLREAPLFRAKLLHTGPEEHVLLLAMHHIISDGWSLGVLVQELNSLYVRCSSGRPSPLAEISVQYADYARWQRRSMQGELLETQLAYWKQYLKDAPPGLELPADHPRPNVQNFRGGGESFVIARERMDGVRALNRREGVTLFMTLLGTFETLLHRYSGQADFCVGTPIANRNRSETEGLIGLFVNTIVLRAEIETDTTFTSLLERIRQATFGAYAHQDVPFELLVDELKVERHLSRSPLFQVMLVLNNAPIGELHIEGIDLCPLDLTTSGAKFDLTLTAIESQGELFCSVEYNAHLFEPATIKRLASHFQELLAAAIRTPEAPISELSLMPGSERQQFLFEWNDTHTTFPDLLIHQLIESQSDRRPSAIAAVLEDKHLSYRDLDERANRLAGYLRSLGIEHDALVGICLERSLEMLVAILGVLKAGAAYVPFEPGHPPERLAFMMEDSHPAVLLSRQEDLAQPQAAYSKRVYLDTDWGEIAAANGYCGAGDIGSDSLCYVIYTSGSTGVPKAAMNTHRGVANRLQWMQYENGLDESDCVLHKAPITFDVSAPEIFAPLIAGAKLVVARAGGHQDSGYLARLVRLEGITALHFVPSMLQVFLEEDGIETLMSLKRVVCSGEALPDRLIERHAQRMGADLYNLYGPTEASIEVSKWRCDQSQRTSIGKPIANAQLYLLNGHRQPAPIGVPGELYIGGVPLARGYLNRPDMTAERFEPSPYGELGSRTYRTGDLARVRHDGNIEYLGRIDHQVKVRGFRIELAEVESALSLHPDVDSCAVAAFEEPSGSVGLAGYIAHHGGSLAIDGLRAFLEQKLPEYMIPSAFVVLDSLPLNPNGKVDRRALPPPNREIAVSRQAFVAPETDIELALASIWVEVLGIERVSVNDNFFDLGGHSLSATRVLSQVQRRFQVEIALRSFFETPSIAGFALLIEGALVKKLEALTDAEAEVMLRGMDASKDSPR